MEISAEHEFADEIRIGAILEQRIPDHLESVLDPSGLVDIDVGGHSSGGDVLHEGDLQIGMSVSGFEALPRHFESRKRFMQGIWRSLVEDATLQPVG